MLSLPKLLLISLLLLIADFAVAKKIKKDPLYQGNIPVENLLIRPILNIFGEDTLILCARLDDRRYRKDFFWLTKDSLGNNKIIRGDWSYNRRMSPNYISKSYLPKNYKDYGHLHLNAWGDNYNMSCKVFIKDSISKNVSKRTLVLDTLKQQYIFSSPEKEAEFVKQKGYYPPSEVKLNSYGKPYRFESIVTYDDRVTGKSLRKEWILK